METKTMKKIIQLSLFPLVFSLLLSSSATIANEDLINIYVRNANVNSTHEIKNVILFIGDGMGPNHIEAGEIYKGSDLTFSNPNDPKWTYHGYQNTDSLTSEGFKLDTSKSLLRPDLNESLYDNNPSPYAGNGNYMANTRYTDSAAGGTALATGKKTTNSLLGVDNFGNQLTNLVEIASSLEKKTGVVSSDSLTGATPSSFLSHVEERHLYDEILNQVVNAPANLVMAERPSNWSSTYESKYASAGWSYASSLSQTNINANKEIVLVDGLVGDSYVTPALSDLTMYALDKLDNENGFFLMVEGSSIDTASHEKQPATMLKELMDFDMAVKTAADWAYAREDTLIVVTADHETGALTYDRENATQDNIIESIEFLSGNHSRTRVTVDVYGDASEFFLTYQNELDRLGILNEGMEDECANYFDNTDVFKLLASYL